QSGLPALPRHGLRLGPRGRVPAVAGASAALPARRRPSRSTRRTTTASAGASRPGHAPRTEADQELLEQRATAVAQSKDDELRIIDTYLAGFEKALAEGRVRFDNPGDFNTMVRLKEFVMGGADSRQEIHASLSLEDIQARHQRMIRVVGET